MTHTLCRIIDKRMKKPFFGMMLLICLFGFALASPNPPPIEAQESINTHAVELMQFYGRVAVAAVVICGSLITYIFVTGLSGMQAILLEKINGVGARVDSLEGRINYNDGRINVLQGKIEDDFLTVKMHNAICEKKID